MSHIESRQSQRYDNDYEFMVEFCAGEQGVNISNIFSSCVSIMIIFQKNIKFIILILIIQGDVAGVIDEIKKQSTYMNIISRNYKDNEGREIYNTHFYSNDILFLLLNLL